MRTSERVLPIKRKHMVRVLRYLLDSLLACAGSLLVTGVIVLFHLYPAIPDIALVYLPIVLVLAIVRGRYAAILGAVVAFLALAYFIVPPLYTFAEYRPDEWLALFIFLSVALLTGQLTAVLHKRTEQANRREHETRQLYQEVQATSREAEQAHQRLLAYEQAALREAEAARARLHNLFMQVPAAMAILRGPEHRYEFVNPLALRHRDRADVVGKTICEVLPELVEQGGIGGILIHSVEVTEQVLARLRIEGLNRQLKAEKDALRQAKQEAEARATELSAIFEAMIEAVIVCDARGEIRYSNAAYRSTLALEEDADPVLLQLDTRYEWLA
jgi:K+-sensing histidine kinase KdpD